MQIMVDLVMDLLDRTASEVAFIIELEGKETLTINEISTGARLALREQGQRKRMPSPTGPESRVLRHIEVQNT